MTAQWHEAKAADLLRGDGKYPASQGEVERAAVHVELAKSMRRRDEVAALSRIAAALERRNRLDRMR